MTLPSISVIIPTYGREKILRNTLENVVQQDYPNYEVLVIDQTPQHEPATETCLAELATAQRIRWFRVDWANLPAARNYGVRRARGELILFLDDDVEIPDGFLQAHAQNYTDPTIGAVAGRIFDRMKLAEAAPGLVIDLLPPEAMHPGIAWYYLDLVHTRQPQQVITARGCNMSFRRELFDQHNLWFDERFRGSAVREESDFCLRIRQTGFKIWYDPQAHLVHFGEMTGGCHDISTRSFQYQITFYHNNFLMGLKNLSFRELLLLFLKTFNCNVLGHPPCYKSGSPIKVASRAVFYGIGFLAAIKTIVQSCWDAGQVYSQQDELLNRSSGLQTKPFAMSNLSDWEENQGSA